MSSLLVLQLVVALIGHFNCMTGAIGKVTRDQAMHMIHVASRGPLAYWGAGAIPNRVAALSPWCTHH